MLRTRVIPALLLQGESLVKTTRFGQYTYVGDPCNSVRIFNELEVDELIFLDISASRNNTAPYFKILAEIADECFMPLTYGGGISTVEHAKEIFRIGFEKVAINSHAHQNLTLISNLAEHFGSQAIIGAIDVKRSSFGTYQVRSHSDTKGWQVGPVDWAKELEQRGVGEILITSVDREGSWQGFDLDIIKKVADSVSVPVIAHGGAGNVQHIEEAVNDAGASAVALGSMVTFQKQGMGVLLTFPDESSLKQVIPR